MTNYEKAAEEYVEKWLHRNVVYYDKSTRTGIPKEFRDEFEKLLTKTFLAGCEHARPKWISVKDRLPPVNEEVWCLSPTFGQHVDSYTGSTFKNDDPMKFIDDLTGKGIIGTIHEFRGNREYYCWDVTHWMPLLDKPEGEG